MEIKDLKREYELLEKKYKLPSFKELNENFEIDKIDKDSDLIIRTIRKVIMEKLINSINFLEFLINPVNAPRMYMNYLKNISVADKEIIDEIYSAFAKISLDSLDLEVNYSEKNEAELIINVNKLWNEKKSNFSKILAHIKSPQPQEARKEKSYFG
ncbi:MAG: hypothetical protein WCK29_01715 [archaeon]